MFRVLAEEWERREELERLQEEQNKMLQEERVKRQQFEQLQAAKEMEFRGMSKTQCLIQCQAEGLVQGFIQCSVMVSVYCTLNHLLGQSRVESDITCIIGIFGSS